MRTGWRAATRNTHAPTRRMGAFRAVRCLLPFIAALAYFQNAPNSYADDSIGGAQVVVNRVRGNLASGGVVPVTQGDGVFRDEAVRTDVDSTAKIVLLDATNLSLGPSSSIKIDRFVYSGAGQHGAIAFNLAKGAFRFVTGDADKAAYTITTPTATLGVRGTILRIVSTSAETSVIVEEGSAIACTRRAAIKRCAELNCENMQAVITATRIATTACSSGAAPGGGRPSHAATVAPGAVASSGGGSSGGGSSGGGSSGGGPSGGGSSGGGSSGGGPSGGGSSGGGSSGGGSSGGGPGNGNGNGGNAGNGGGNTGGSGPGTGNGGGNGNGGNGNGGAGNGNGNGGNGCGAGNGNGNGGNGNGGAGNGNGH
jgi:FecR protein